MSGSCTPANAFCARGACRAMAAVGLLPADRLAHGAPHPAAASMEVADRDRPIRGTLIEQGCTNLGRRALRRVKRNGLPPAPNRPGSDAPGGARVPSQSPVEKTPMKFKSSANYVPRCPDAARPSCAWMQRKEGMRCGLRATAHGSCKQEFQSW